jgi:hypothetical protein
MSTGQPSMALYDWALGVHSNPLNGLELNVDLENRLAIEKFCDKIVRYLYSNPVDPRGLLPEQEQSTRMSLLQKEYLELKNLTESTFSRQYVDKSLKYS